MIFFIAASARRSTGDAISVFVIRQMNRAREAPARDLKELTSEALPAQKFSGLLSLSRVIRDEVNSGARFNKRSRPTYSVSL
jgi:hypothetical protein